MRRIKSHSIDGYLLYRNRHVSRPSPPMHSDATREQDYKYRCEHDQKFVLSILLRQSCFEPLPCDPVSSRDISIDQKQPHRTVNFIVIPNEYFERLFTTLWFNHYVFPFGASMHLHLEFTFLSAGRNLYVTKQIIHTHTYN